jgi:HSP20 family protein
MQNDFDRALSGFFEAAPLAATTDFSPQCEFVEDEARYTVKFDIPGVKKEDVKIELSDNQLTVSAERREEKETESRKRLYSEFSYGSYQRMLTLPTGVNDKGVTAKFDNGVLTVTLPKSEASKAKQISVQ